MRIAIAGSTGMLGNLCGAHLNSRGHQVLRLVRGRASGPGERSWDPESGRIAAPGLADVDAVINFAGAGMADARWTNERKQLLRRSRISSTITIVHALSPDGRCRRLLNASAIGYYGNTGPEIVDENSGQGAGFLARLAGDWEAAAAHSPVPFATLRSGHVLTDEGGFLGKQRLLFQLGLGGRIGNGRQFVSWIGAEDYIRAVDHLLLSTLTGPVNLVGPSPVTNATFTRHFAASLRRPALLPMPLPAVRILFGSQMVDEALLSSTRALPRRLLDDGFGFVHPELTGALAALGDCRL